MNSESFSWMKSKKLSQWREKKRRKNEEKNEEAHQITFLSVRLGTEKETMKKMGSNIRYRFSRNVGILCENVFL